MIGLLADTAGWEFYLVLAVILIIFWPFKGGGKGGGPRCGFFCATIEENEGRPEKPKWKLDLPAEGEGRRWVPGQCEFIAHLHGDK